MPQTQQRATFRWEYNPEHDLLYASEAWNDPAESVEVEPGVYVRVSLRTRNIIGLEVLDCAERFNIDPKRINEKFVRELMALYVPAARERLAARRRPSAS